MVTRVAVLGAVMIALLSWGAVRASAAGTLPVSPPDPVAGDTVTTVASSTECPVFHQGHDGPPVYTFSFDRVNADGTMTQVASGPGTTDGQGELEFSAVLASAGNYQAHEDIYCASDQSHTPYDSDVFPVGTGLSGSIAVTPDPPTVNQPATIVASAAGGNPGYTFAFDLNNSGTFTTPSATRTISDTFTTTGPHVVNVRITDSGQGGTNNPSHTVTVTRTINVQAPPTTTTGTTTTPAPAPPPCLSRVAFKLSEFTTTGCFTQTSSSPQQWTTTSAVKLNGILLPDYGQTFTITAPSTADPGGHFTAPSSTIQLDGFTALSGNIDWSLPDGGAGQELAIPGQSFKVASGATLLGLHVLGSIALELGETSDGTYYADFPLSIQLPAGFTAGPDPAFGTVTGSASLRVDDAGVHYNGLKLEAKDVWLGKLKVDSVCFSYIPASGMSTTPCDAPSFGGDTGPIAQPGGDAPFLQCATDPTTNRWDASAEIEVPSGLQLGAYGGLADGQLSKLGASVNNLGRRVPLGYGLYLDHVAFGLCLSPAPIKIRANVGANFLGAGNLVNIDGGFTYTDAAGYNPWSLELDGSVSIGEEPDALPIGSGTLGVNGSGIIDFGLNAGIDVLGGFASLDAKVYGWIDAPKSQFVIGGEGQGCIAGQCADAEGEISSTGVAGCVTVGSSIPTYDLIIPLDGSPVHLDDSTYPLTAGFGYDWGASSAQLLGGSCDFSAYEPADFLGGNAIAASSAMHLRVARDTRALALRVHGTLGAPNIVLHGPRGTTIKLPANRPGKLSRGHYLIAANRTDGTTDVLLVHPAAGNWTIASAPGAVSSPTKLDQATLQDPPTFAGRVTGKGRARTLRLAYAAPVGTSIRIRERAKAVNHTLTTRPGGRRCPGLPALRPGTQDRILCTHVRFRAAEGPGGTRRIEVDVMRHGIPLLQKDIASFRAPRLTVPTRIPALRAERRHGSLLIAFARSADASHYAVSVKLSSGPERSFYLGDRCQALRIRGVPAATAATVKIAGVRYDLVMGHSRSLSIAGGTHSSGVKARKLRLGRVCS